MREKLRYALIGCGRIAPNHIAAYLNNAEDLELCAVCDPVSERMEAVLRPLPEQDRARVRRYTDHRELLAKEAPQLLSLIHISNHAKGDATVEYLLLQNRHAFILLTCV